ncbi:MAG: hypothetical protein IJE45_02480, partial [Bacilli bacterium]|nr:hypothetical protein [Bacilli bacterium]
MKKTVSLRKILITGGILLVLLGLVLFLILGQKKPEVTIDSNSFHSVEGFDMPLVEYNQEVDYSDIVINIVKNNKKTKINVTKEMVVSCDSTSSVGQKHLVIKYDDETYTIDFVVKYKVQFIVDGTVVSSQYVSNASEIKIPETPKKALHEFTGWLPEVPSALANNLVIEAQFTDKPKEVPTLYAYEAEYSDLLSSITLPSNDYGKWEFVDEVTNTVGNIGVNKFKVKFIPTNTELQPIEDEVSITVSKKEIEFKNLVTLFTYDGQPHKPTYTLDVENLNVTYMGGTHTEVGVYTFFLKIDDPNYEGSVTGEFEIIKPEQITIEVHNKTMSFGAEIPEITYTVTGIDESKLTIEKIIPDVGNVGTYELTVKVNNENLDINIVKGTLTVNPVELFSEEEIKSLSESIRYDYEGPIYYLDELKNIPLINENPYGTWSWKTTEGDEGIISNAGEFKTYLVFEPNSKNYVTQEVEHVITVEKKILTITILENEYIYDGNPHKVEFLLENGDEQYKYLVDKIQGNNEYTNVSVNAIELNLVDDNYQANYKLNLEIQEATPETDFTKVFNVEWGTAISTIGLDKGYAWNDSLTILDMVGDGQMFSATYTKTDENGNPDLNYKQVTGQFTINVSKKKVSIEIIKNEFDYDSSEKTISYKVMDGTKDITSSGELLNNPVETEAGTYNTTLEFSSDTYTATLSSYLKINPIEVSNKPIKFVATYGDTLGSLVLPVSEFGEWTWEDGDSKEVGTKGTHTFKANFNSTNVNYKNCDAFVEVVVSPKKVTIVIEQSSFIYNEKAQTILYKVMDVETDITTSVTVIGNVTRTNVGTTNTTLELDEMNYIADAVKVALTIANENCPDVVSPSNLTAIYGDLLSSVILTNDSSNIEGTWSWNQTGTVGNAGTNSFQATFTPKNTNYLPITVSLSVKVEKKELTINVTNNRFAYDGSAHTIAYTVTGMVNGDAVPSVDGNVSQVNAGTYNTTLVIDNNNYYGSISTNLVIEQIEESKEHEALSAIYGDTLDSITLPTSEHGTWNWKDDPSTLVGDVGTHTFEIIFTPTDKNYKETKTTISVKVVQKTVEIIIDQFRFSYDESEHAIVVKVMDGETDITSLVTVNGIVTRTIVGTTNTTISINSKNYTATPLSTNLVVEVGNYTPSVNPSGLTATYGDQLSSVTLTNDASNKDGVWSWDQTGTVGNAGTNSFQATFTPNDTNYAPSTHTLSVVVEKATVVINVTNNTFTYDGSAHTIAYTVTGMVNGDAAPSVDGNVSKT